ncbi:unnamed protein product [Schistosoma mattheei]|uniref:Uncharacterized protein n=1 Tax=Schistosoma mattheei TaxID=31246 RepID=A0AA85BRW9_9TREM|nr:unnamed protein product [Schistosoma mattheei]
MRLSVTVSVMYMGPFLLNSLKMDKSSMVSAPLVTTISCLITSVGVQRINKLLGNYIGSVLMKKWKLWTDDYLLCPELPSQ